MGIELETIIGMDPAKVGPYISQQPCAAGLFTTQIINGEADVNVLVVGDSTGNNSTEWVYLFGEWLGAQYPTHSVDYHLWNDGTGAYDSASSLASGSGSNTINIYNASVAGARINRHLGDEYPAAIRDIPTCALVIINHGHNHVSGYVSYPYDNIRIPEFKVAAADITAPHGNCGLIFVAQNPRRDDDLMAPLREAVTSVAGSVNADLADVYTLFEDTGRDSGLYVDNQHPSASGTALFLEAVTRCFVSRKAKTNQASVGLVSANIIPNGNFEAFAGAVPDGWAASANATTTKDATIYDSSKAYSVKITPTAPGTSSLLTWTATAAQLAAAKGKWLTLTARVYVPSGTMTSTTGRITLATSSSSSNNSLGTTPPVDGWFWISLSVFVKPTDTYMQVRLYGDSGVGNGEAHFDRVSLAYGLTLNDQFSG